MHVCVCHDIQSDTPYDMHIFEINDIVARKYIKGFKNKLIHIYVHTSMTYESNKKCNM